MVQSSLSDKRKEIISSDLYVSQHLLNHNHHELTNFTMKSIDNVFQGLAAVSLENALLRERVDQLEQTLIKIYNQDVTRTPKRLRYKTMN